MYDAESSKFGMPDVLFDHYIDRVAPSSEGDESVFQGYVEEFCEAVEEVGILDDSFIMPEVAS